MGARVVYATSHLCQPPPNHPTSSFLAPPKLFEAAGKETSHIPRFHLHFTPTLNLLPQQEASDNRYPSLHSNRSCPKSYLPSVPHLKSRTAFHAYSTQLFWAQADRPSTLFTFF
ncbi:uncharacterized protein K460DRAFT_152489 [Cucurbitaria berberidis CBS 394.84]|uniref:Uncharacterized protein n=1 Tax=Cucurbitaria berberidis CBS 394.84 TaxID=1168544 RepID=A0A9P4GEE3_9PLEO|nr:uncharacterized protein K460DRAFT_152489 [Cucurbitaria berberidis CBS 394.84]KAF1843852.1 hypothetical protein K460DRAFT_152489 [Cucurbitaria berberidis CBS 394.84]